MDETAGQRPPSRRIWASINRSPRITLLLLIGLYLVIAIAQASFRLLWCDELITVAVAHTGNAQGIWGALTNGADPNPPLTHLAVLVSTRVFGNSALAVRLPAIASMLLALCSIWALLRRWVAPVFAAVGVLAFMATRGLDYSYEARSYAPLCGFTMAALLCWLRSADHRVPDSGRSSVSGPARPYSALAWLAAMAACLALALSSNYYGFLAWIPIVAGEIVLSLRSRSPNPATWVALAVAAAPLFMYLPLIRHNLAEFGPYAGNRVQFSVITESYLLLVEGVFWPVLFGALWALWKGWGTRAIAPRADPPAHQLSLKSHEWAALIGLLLYPVLGYAAALGQRAMISPRCVLPVCCAFGIAAALLAAKLVTRPRYALTLAGVGIVWVLARQTACAFILLQQRANFVRLVRQINEFPKGPIYISDFILALPLAYYGPPELRARIVYPIDFAAIHASEREDSGEENLWGGRHGVFPIQVVPYSSALAQTQPALVLARPNGWLPRMLAADGLPLSDATSPSNLQLIEGVGGVFTPLDHEETRLLLPEHKTPARAEPQTEHGSPQ